MSMIRFFALAAMESQSLVDSRQSRVSSEWRRRRIVVCWARFARMGSSFLRSPLALEVLLAQAFLQVKFLVYFLTSPLPLALLDFASMPSLQYFRQIILGLVEIRLFPVFRRQAFETILL